METEEHTHLKEKEEERTHSHEHHSHHSHHPEHKGKNNNLVKLWIIVFICLSFMIGEIVFGYIAQSIAIISDAAHLLADLLGFIISIVSIYLGRARADSKMTFGYHRAGVVGAFVSIAIIWPITVWLVYEATLRIIKPKEVNGLIMLIIGSAGLVFNIIMGVTLLYQGIENPFHSHDEEEHHCSEVTAEEEKSLKSKVLLQDEENKIEDKISEPGILLKSLYSQSLDGSSISTHIHSHEGNLSVKAAFIHIIGDTIQNIFVLIAGIIIYFKPKWVIADPICTYIFSVIVLVTTVKILIECLHLLMEGAPKNINLEQLISDLLKIEEIVEVHDLHLWSINVGKISLSCHMKTTDPSKALKLAYKMIKGKYKISHSTIQSELCEKLNNPNSYKCKQRMHS